MLQGNVQGITGIPIQVVRGFILYSFVISNCIKHPIDNNNNNDNIVIWYCTLSI